MSEIDHGRRWLVVRLSTTAEQDSQHWTLYAPLNGCMDRSSTMTPATASATDAQRGVNLRSIDIVRRGWLVTPWTARHHTTHSRRDICGAPSAFLRDLP